MKESEYLTIVLRDTTNEDARALLEHPKISAASWSHAIRERDEARAAMLAEQDKGSIAEQATAWIEVTKALDDVAPRWRSLSSTGSLAATAAIRGLAVPPLGLEKAIEYTLCELAGIDTHDVNLRDHPMAWKAMEHFAAIVREALLASERKD